MSPHERTRPDRSVVIGVGNAWRRDDGVGWLVADAVERRLGGVVDVVRSDGEPARLLDAWDGAATVVVVDAVRTGAVPGRVSVVDPMSATLGVGGTHGAGVADAVALADRLERTPVRLYVVGIEGADFGHGQGCSPPVSAAVDEATRLVCDLVRA